MRTQYIPPVITLLAAAIISILNVINKVDLLFGLKRLLITIFVFYIFGKIIEKIMIKIMKNQEKNDEYLYEDDEIVEKNAEYQKEE